MDEFIKFNKETIENENKKSFFEKIINDDGVALIFLKGGSHGGLNAEVKAEILSRLNKWFEITEGEIKNLSFKEIVTRWGKGYLKYPALDVMKDNANFSKDFLEQGGSYLSKNDEEGFKKWMEQARLIADADVGLLRMEMLMTYYASGGQSILLKLKKEVTREKILQDLQTGSNQSADMNSLDLTKISFQEFVKRFIVGNTTALDALPGTLRSIIAQQMNEGKIFPCADLWGKPNDKWSSNNRLSSHRLVASNLLNAIHAPGSLEELELDVNLLSHADLQKFRKNLD